MALTEDDIADHISRYVGRIYEDAARPGVPSIDHANNSAGHYLANSRRHRGGTAGYVAGLDRAAGRERIGETSTTVS